MVLLRSPSGLTRETEGPLEIRRLMLWGWVPVYDEPRPSPPPPPPVPVPTEFDPNQHTEEEVLAYVAKNPSEVLKILAKEKAGKARVRLVGNGQGG